MGRQVFGTRMVYRETFLQIQRRLLQHFIRKSRILGFLMCQNIHHHMRCVKAKHQFRIRDASQDRQSEIQSSPVRENFQGIMEQTNNDCRFRILILTNSPLQHARSYDRTKTSPPGHEGPNFSNVDEHFCRVLQMLRFFVSGSRFSAEPEDFFNEHTQNLLQKIVVWDVPIMMWGRRAATDNQQRPTLFCVRGDQPRW